MTGSDALNVTEVALIDGTGRTQVTGALQVQVSPKIAVQILNRLTKTAVLTHAVFSAQSLGDSNFLVTFSNVPAGDFVIRLRGEEGRATSRTSVGSSNVLRQVPTRFRTSSVSLTVSKNLTLVILYVCETVGKVRGAYY